MNIYAKGLTIIIGSHCVRWMTEYAYFTRCAGFWSSIFSWNSPTCRGLRWISDSVAANVVSTVGGFTMQLLTQGTNSQ